MEATHLPIWAEYAKVFVIPILSLVGAIYGLTFASKLTESREGKKEQARIDKETSYIAILVAAHLEKVVKACVSITLDGGSYNNTQNVRAVQTSAPAFDPLAIDADWRVLPTTLLQKILELPYKLERTAESVEGAYENDFPRDYDDFFDTRQYDYAVLGLETDAVMFELRKHAGIPFIELKEGEWSRQQIMTDMIKAIDEKRQKHHARWNAANFPPPYVQPAPQSV